MQILIGPQMAALGVLHVQVRRGHVLEDALQQLQAHAHELRKPLKVTFLGGERGNIREEAVDEGARPTPRLRDAGCGSLPEHLHFSLRFMGRGQRRGRCSAAPKCSMLVWIQHMSVSWEGAHARVQAASRRSSSSCSSARSSRPIMACSTSTKRPASSGAALHRSRVPLPAAVWHERATCSAA
jgi:hypothetical protein